MIRLTYRIFFNFFIPLVGGVFYASGFPMFSDTHFAPGAFIGITIFLSSLSIYRRDPKNRKFKYDFFSMIGFSLGFYLLGFYWIPGLLTEFGNIPAPFNYLLGLFFSLVIVPQYFVFIIFHTILRAFKITVTSRTLRNIVIAIVLTLLEQFVPQQFPAHIGHPWLSMAPHLGLAPIFGAPIFSFITYWLATSIASTIKLRKVDIWPVIILIAFTFLNVLLPLQMKPNGEQINLRLVQANIGNNMKVSSEKGSRRSIYDVFNIYRSLSTKPADSQVDLIIWPETAYPQLLSYSVLKKHSNFIPTIFEEIVDQTGANIFFGGYDIISSQLDSFESQYNTAFMINNDKTLQDAYRKTKLIPFGETLPFGPLNRFLSKYVQNISYFAAGTSYPIFHVNNKAYFIPAICYEILFPSLIRNYLNTNKQQADFIVNLTNDSWYGDTSEPYQHLFLAHWRALEFQLPIVRMTNTGISSILYPDGSESDRLKLFEEGILDIKLPILENEKTIYQQYGMLPLVALWILLSFFVLGGRRLFSKRKLKAFL